MVNQVQPSDLEWSWSVSDKNKNQSISNPASCRSLFLLVNGMVDVADSAHFGVMGSKRGVWAKENMD